MLSSVVNSTTVLKTVWKELQRDSKALNQVRREWGDWACVLFCLSVCLSVSVILSFFSSSMSEAVPMGLKTLWVCMSANISSTLTKDTAILIIILILLEGYCVCASAFICNISYFHLSYFDYSVLWLFLSYLSYQTEDTVRNRKQTLSHSWCSKATLLLFPLDNSLIILVLCSWFKTFLST